MLEDFSDHGRGGRVMTDKQAEGSFLQGRAEQSAALIARPKRIQRRRMKGWRMPEGAVYVGRPTRWGNPFRLGTPYALMRVPGACDPTAAAEYEGRISADGASHDYHHASGQVTRCMVRYMTPAECVEHYRRLVLGDLTPSMRMAGWKPPGVERLEEIVRDLAGRDLVCWCPTWQPCHADVLLEIANAQGEHDG